MHPITMALNLLGLGRRPPPPSAARIESPAPAVRQAAPDAYPASDAGIPASAVDELLAANQTLIDRIKICYGADANTFENHILQLIRNYARFVNQLPATPDNYFSGAGGLLRLGLEVGFFGLQGTDGNIVSGRATISTRRELEPRWRRATFIAGLCSELHRTMSHLLVTDAHGDEWPAYMTPLSTWLETRKASRLFIRWIQNAQESRSLGLFALPHIVPPAMLQELAKGNNTVVPHMLSSISGTAMYRDHNILDELVRRSAALVIHRDLAASAHRYGRPILGAHLERYLVDAMRQLVALHPAWAVNQERSRVWLGEDGLFIVWPNAAADIRQVLTEAQLQGIPGAPATIVEILGAAGVLEPTDGGGYIWAIAPVPGKAALEAIRLISPDVLLPSSGDRPTPLPRPVGASPRSAPQSTAASTGATATVPSQSVVAQATPTPVAAAAATTAAVPIPGPLNPDDGSATSPSALSSSTQQHELCFTDAPAAQPSPTNDPSAAGGSSPSPGEDRRTAASTAAGPADTPLKFALKAPMRLAPAVRDALISIIDTLNGDMRQAAACTVSTGLFVPLSELHRRKVEPSVALRSIGEANIAANAKNGRVQTVEHDFGGRHELGFILLPSVVQGFDPSDFTSSL